MDLTLTEETTATASATDASLYPFASPQQPASTAQPGTATAAGSASTSMDFFFPGALDQLTGATELDVQLNPLLMNRVTQLCLAKISIASSGRESLRRVAQLSWYGPSFFFFLSRLEKPSFFRRLIS